MRGLELSIEIVSRPCQLVCRRLWAGWMTTKAKPVLGRRLRRLVLDQAVGLPGEDAHRRDLVDRRAEFPLAVVLGHVDEDGQHLAARVGVRLDRIAVEVGVEHGLGIHRHRPALAAGFGRMRGPCEPLAQRVLDLLRRQGVGDRAPQRRALRVARLDLAVPQRILLAGARAVEVDIAVEVGPARQRAGGRRLRRKNPRKIRCG